VQNLSADISVRLLSSGMMRGQTAEDIRKKIDVFLTQALTSSHGRMLSHEEAQKCGLSIKLIDLHSDVWHIMWQLYVRSNWAVTYRNQKVIETCTTAVNA